MNECQGCGTPIVQPRYGRRKWCSERCRKTTLYSGTCDDCGKATDPSNGPNKAPSLCAACFQERNYGAENRVIAAMWARGVPAKAIARSTGLTEMQVIHRVTDQRRRGSHDHALRLRPNLDAEEEQRLIDLWNAGESAERIALELGYKTADSVYGAVQHRRNRGVALKPRYRR